MISLSIWHARNTSPPAPLLQGEGRGIQTANRMTIQFDEPDSSPMRRGERKMLSRTRCSIASPSLMTREIVHEWMKLPPRAARGVGGEEFFSKESPMRQWRTTTNKTLPSPFGRGVGGEGCFANESPMRQWRTTTNKTLPSPFGRGAGGEGCFANESLIRQWRTTTNKTLPSPFGRGAGGEGVFSKEKDERSQR
jgi:hypothetical protein